MDFYLVGVLVNEFSIRLENIMSPLFYLYMAIPLVLGIYLTHGGFTSKSHS